MQRAVVALAFFALTGCGTGGMAEEASVGSGQQLFREKCGSCHVLADAGTNGVIGPNLDDAFRVSLDEGFSDSTVREVVLDQMRFPIPPMPTPEELFPAGEYSDAERDEALVSIAAYVSAVAARPSAQGGGGAASDETDPQTLFTGNCAGCHRLAAARASGTVGPSLDRTTLDRAAIEQQIRRGGGGMPPFEGRLTDRQIQALATFVAENRRR